MLAYVYSKASSQPIYSFLTLEFYVLEIHYVRSNVTSLIVTLQRYARSETMLENNSCSPRLYQKQNTMILTQGTHKYAYAQALKSHDVANPSPKLQEKSSAGPP